MRLILSRKGFDSAAGGVASPILEDGTMLPLPIPDPGSRIRYGDIRLHGHEIGRVVSDLTHGRIRATSRAHLDPDVVTTAIKRPRGWRPIFGQADAEATVLSRAGVGVGDVFLSFGWYRRAERHDGRYRFVHAAPDLHVLWGWMQVGAVIDVAQGPVPDWARYHPHLSRARRTNNTLYVAADRLTIGGKATKLPGAGVFGRFRQELCLTADGCSRSIWSLPAWFHPDHAGFYLGYHADRRRWGYRGGRAQLRSVSRGQEFVLDVGRIRAAADWIRRLVGATRRRG